MSAFVLVFAHRFFAVTDDDGRYRIENVPPGTYTVMTMIDRDTFVMYPYLQESLRSWTVLPADDYGYGADGIGGDPATGAGTWPTSAWRCRKPRAAAGSDASISRWASDRCRRTSSGCIASS